jgi:microcystin-dependent protein
MDSDFLRLARRVKNIEEVFEGDALQEVGAIALWPMDTPPQGWLLCDGNAVSRSAYAELFGVIGMAYGSGDGSTTFNVPDLKGKVPVGKHVSQSEFNTLGLTGGERTHTLTTTEMPAHTHNNILGNGSGTITTAQISANLAHFGTSQASASAGGGGSHNNLQPYIVLNYIIRYESKERALRGDRGDKGERGDRGTAGTSYRLRGEWMESAAYERSEAYIDCVVSGGSTYYCKAPNTGHAVTDTAYWGLLVQKGDTGATGSTGPAGATGVSNRMNGEYSGATAYVNDSAYIDCVTYLGSAYYAKQNTTGHSPVDTVYWGLLAQKGADGAGDLTGPGPVTDGHIALFDGSTGKVIKSAGKGLPGGAIADTSSTQTLSNKTLSSPAVTSPPSNIARLPGEIVMWGGSTALAGWLICNGAAVSRATYAALFAVTGTAYGSGDGSTTFNLPDLRGRMAAGLKGADAEFDTLGETGGEKTHMLTTVEMPAHQHESPFPSNSGTSGSGNYGEVFGYGRTAAETGQGVEIYNLSDSNWAAEGNEVHPLVSSSGSGGAHNNLPPYIVLNYIIKV